MLKNLRIHRFRGIRELELRDLAQVNVLIGRNNVGKSSVLEALYLASAAFNLEDPLGRGDKITYLLNRRGKRGLTWKKSKKVLWYGYDDSEDIKVGLRIDGEPLDVWLHRGHEHPSVSVEPASEKPTLYCLHCGIYYHRDTQKWNKAFPLELVTKMEEVLSIVSRLKDFLKAMMFIDASLLRNIGRVEEKLWTPLLQERLDKFVIEVMRGGYGLPIEDLTYAYFGGEIQLLAKLPRTSIRVDDLGDGARYAIVVIMAAAVARNTALLIEEPESHQHPGGLAKMLDMLLALAKRNKIQLFMSTHSIELVRLAEAIGREKGLEVATFFLERDEEGRVDARRIEPSDRRLLADLGLDVRFLDVI